MSQKSRLVLSKKEENGPEDDLPNDNLSNDYWGPPDPEPMPLRTPFSLFYGCIPGGRISSRVDHRPVPTEVVEARKALIKMSPEETINSFMGWDRSVVPKEVCEVGQARAIPSRASLEDDDRSRKERDYIFSQIPDIFGWPNKILDLRKPMDPISAMGVNPFYRKLTGTWVNRRGLQFLQFRDEADQQVASCERLKKGQFRILERTFGKNFVAKFNERLKKEFQPSLGPFKGKFPPYPTQEPDFFVRLWNNRLIAFPFNSVGKENDQEQNDTSELVLEGEITECLDDPELGEYQEADLDDPDFETF